MMKNLPGWVVPVFIASASMLAWTGALGDERSLEDDLKQLTSGVQAAQRDDEAQRRDAMREVTQVLRRHAGTDEDAAIVVAMLDLSLEREELLSRPLDRLLGKLAEAADEGARRVALYELQDEMFGRAAHFIWGLSKQDVDVE